MPKAAFPANDCRSVSSISQTCVNLLQSVSASAGIRQLFATPRSVQLFLYSLCISFYWSYLTPERTPNQWKKCWSRQNVSEFRKAVQKFRPWNLAFDLTEHTAMTESYNSTISLNETTFNATNTSAIYREEFSSAVLQFSESFRLYVVAICLVVGVVCNVLALLVFCRRSMRRTTSSCYLAALSATDTIVLITEGKKRKRSFLHLISFSHLFSQCLIYDWASVNQKKSVFHSLNRNRLHEVIWLFMSVNLKANQSCMFLLVACGKLSNNPNTRKKNLAGFDNNSPTHSVASPIHLHQQKQQFQLLAMLCTWSART